MPIDERRFPDAASLKIPMPPMPSPRTAALGAGAAAMVALGVVTLFDRWEREARIRADEMATLRAEVERITPEEVCGTPQILAMANRKALDAGKDAARNAVATGTLYGSGYARELERIMDDAHQVALRANALYMRALEVPKNSCAKPRTEREMPKNTDSPADEDSRP